VITIWKTALHPDCQIKMPVDAQILSVGKQGDGLCMWYLVDTDGQDEYRRFIVYGTGHDIDERGLEYIDTVMMEEFLVFHVFEKV